MTTARSEEANEFTKQSSYGTAVSSDVSFASDDSDHDAAKDREYSNSKSTVALCLCMLTHSYLLISVFPYAGFMAIDLVPDANEETAGSYAGLIASMFMIGRSLSAYSWGKIADTYGRTFCLYSTLLSSFAFTLLFGLAPSFGMALFWRFCLGLGNGMVGTAKTLVSELARGDEKLEARAMGAIIAMWGWGFLIGPAVSGFLAEPVSQYADFWNQSHCQKENVCGWFFHVLSTYPFLLPNLVGAMLCLCSILAVRSCVQETLPSDQQRSIQGIPQDLVLIFKRVLESLHRPSRAREEEASPLRVTTEGSDPTPKDEATMTSLWARSSTRRHLLVYWGASFLAIAVDETFPLLCLSQQAGLGLSEVSIGKILSLSGLLFAVFQYPIYACLVRRLGLYGSIRWGLLAMMPLVFLIPVTVPLNKAGKSSLDGSSSLTWTALIYSGTLLALYRIFGLLFFSNITIATNRTVPAHHRATMNGFATLGGSATKAAGPFLAGCIFAFSASSSFIPAGVGAVLPFVALGSFGLVLAAFSIDLPSSEHYEDADKASTLAV